MSMEWRERKLKVTYPKHNWIKLPDNKWDIPVFKCRKCGVQSAGEIPILDFPCSVWRECL